MEYNLSSERLSHPILVPILKVLSEVFEQTGIKFYIIGATARDIMMEIHGEYSSRRLTYDLDIAIAIEDWSQYKLVEKTLLNHPEITKDKTQRQRFFYENKYDIDIVPFGAIMKNNEKIFWPPDESFAMTVLSFKEVQDHIVSVGIDEDLNVGIASLPGIFILKLVAWRDRGMKNNKDADDLGFILRNFLEIRIESANEYYEEIYTPDFTEFRAGGILVGKEISAILEQNQASKELMMDILTREVELEEESLLINQILETHRSLKYEEVRDGLFNIIKELKK